MTRLSILFTRAELVDGLRREAIALGYGLEVGGIPPADQCDYRPLTDHNGNVVGAELQWDL